MQEEKKPDFSKPVDIQAYFYHAFHACGCSELDGQIPVLQMSSLLVIWRSLGTKNMAFLYHLIYLFLLTLVYVFNVLGLNYNLRLMHSIPISFGINTIYISWMNPI